MNNCRHANTPTSHTVMPSAFSGGQINTQSVESSSEVLAAYFILLAKVLCIDCVPNVPSPDVAKADVPSPNDDSPASPRIALSFKVGSVVGFRFSREANDVGLRDAPTMTRVVVTTADFGGAGDDDALTASCVAAADVWDSADIRRSRTSKSSKLSGLMN